MTAGLVSRQFGTRLPFPPFGNRWINDVFAKSWQEFEAVCGDSDGKAQVLACRMRSDQKLIFGHVVNVPKK